MPLINCKIKLIPTWSANCIISEVDRATTYAIIKAKKKKNKCDSV